MPRSERPESSASFWRCGHCGTPNPRASYLTHCIGCGVPRPAPASRPQAAGSAGSPPPPRPGPRRGRWIKGLSWSYAFVVLALLALIRWFGDRWWPATVLLFLPRWLLLAPVPLLALAAALMRRWSAWAIQGATTLVILGPVMGLSLPWHQLGARPPRGLRVRIMTLNLGAGRIDVKRLAHLIEREHIQVLCFQENRGGTDPALEALFSANGWHRDHLGVFASRFPLIGSLEEDYFSYGGPDLQPLYAWRVRVRAGPGQEFHLVSFHMPTMRPAFEALAAGDPSDVQRHSDWRWRQAANAMNFLMGSGETPVLIGGDFNTPPDSPIMEAFRASYRSGFEEAGWGYGYTRPTRMPWVRIDYILASPDWSFTRCWVGPKVGSDHLPLIAEVVLTPPRRPARPSSAGPG
ncbi:MAG: endonuclease/exonuclease/phosphatase family protein [Isosphaeraceae bacterium]|nr:endonuclease/exonuclease/phosphatase family protein [Isosphaeraceae bacterium]